MERSHRSRRATGIALACALLVVAWGSAACAEDTPAVSSSLEAVITPVAAAPTLPATSEQTGFAEVFVDMAAAAAPMTVYGLAELPEGVTVPLEWWPIVDLSSPAEYDGPVVKNPRILGDEAVDPEMQLVLEYQGGWLGIFENFRGDPGDADGEEVGAVAGHRAILYDVDGAPLVQWSDEGRWYCVLGRGVSADEVVRIALQMQIVSY